MSDNLGNLWDAEVIPQDEAALITGVLDLRMEPDTETHISSLEPEAFVVASHRTIWKALQTLTQSGKTIDSWSMKKAMGALKASDQDYQVLDRYFSDAQWAIRGGIKDRVKIVAETYKRRLITRSMEALASNPDLSVEDLYTQLAEIMDKVSQAGNSRYESGTDYTRQFDAFLSGEAILPAEARDNLVCFGLPTVDDTVVANAGRLVVLGAMPSCGKTALAIQAAIRTAQRGQRVIMASLEMDADEIASRIVACLFEVNSKIAMRRGVAPDPKRAKEIDAIKKNLIGLHGCSGDSWHSIEAAITREYRKNKASVAIVDYLQLMNGTPRKGETEAAMIGEITKGAKRLAQKLGMCVILVSQFNREVKEGQEPTLQNLLGSGQIERDADVALLLWNESTNFDPRGDRPINVRVAKNRAGERNDKFTLTFKASFNTFIESVRETNSNPWG